MNTFFLSLIEVEKNRTNYKVTIRNIVIHKKRKMTILIDQESMSYRIWFGCPYSIHWRFINGLGEYWAFGTDYPTNFRQELNNVIFHIQSLGSFKKKNQLMRVNDSIFSNFIFEKQI
jgi:hypothetical protein